MRAITGSPDSIATCRAARFTLNCSSGSPDASAAESALAATSFRRALIARGPQRGQHRRRDAREESGVIALLRQTQGAMGQRHPPLDLGGDRSGSWTAQPGGGHT